MSVAVMKALKEMDSIALVIMQCIGEGYQGHHRTVLGIDKMLATYFVISLILHILFCGIEG